MPEKRADTLLKTMQYIEWFTLDRAWRDLTDEELIWEPVPGSWSVRRRADCRTATPFATADSDVLADFDADLDRAADEGEAVVPLTTIAWLMWHIGSMPGRLADLDFLGGSTVTASGWTSPGLTPHPAFTKASDAVNTMRAGWRTLEHALEAATDEALERPTRRYSYTDQPGQLAYGAAIIASTLNEISHHGTQVCMLRDLYLATGGGYLATAT